MKNLIVILALGLISVSLNIPVSAGGSPAKRKPARKETSSKDPSLLDLVRRAQEAAESAQAESRQARAEIESLKREMASLKTELSRLQPGDCGSRIADCGLQSGFNKDGNEEASPSAQSAIRNPQSAIDNDERLAKIEEQLEINSAQIKEHAQTKVESDSRFRVRLFGMILANTYLNSNDYSLSDNPLFARQPEPGERKNNVGASLRQTKIGLSMTGPRLGNARLSAEVETDFWGGGPNNVLGFFRVRTATANLDWERTSIQVGQRAPIISPREPTSIAAVWRPSLTGAGNLWQWRPQLAIEHRPSLSEKSELVLQGAFLPSFGEGIGGEELEGPPSYQSRIAYRRKSDSGRNFEVGFGGHFGKREFEFRRNVDGYIVSSDWLIPLGSRFEISGEAYHGRSVSLSEDSGANIDRLFAFNGPLDDARTIVRGVRSSGGWLQFTAQARRDLEFNFAYGQEDPSDRDIVSGIFTNQTRFKNQVGSANFIYHLRSNFLMSVEYRRMWTDYSTGRFKNNHYNLGFGYQF
jgi:hypothetical protein